MSGIGKDNTTFQKFLANCVRWLVTQEDSKRVRIRSDKDIYRSGEKITLTAETYYEDYRSLNGADVKVTIQGTTENFEVSLNSIDNGKYEGDFHVLAGGDYRYKGEAVYQNKKIGEDSGRFSVEEFSLEFLDTKMNETLLKQMALKSKGAYFTAEQISAIDSVLNFPDKKKYHLSSMGIVEQSGTINCHYRAIKCGMVYSEKEGDAVIF